MPVGFLVKHLGINKQNLSVCLFQKSRLFTVILFITPSLSARNWLYVIFPFITYRPCLQAFFHGIILRFQCSLDLSVWLHFLSLTTFRNITKPSSFWGTIANKAEVWWTNQMGNMTTGKDNWTKIHWIGGSFSIWSIWLKISAGLHLCTISAARTTVHLSEKLLREWINKSGIL